MTSSGVLATYTRLRQTQRALNNRLTKTLSKKAIEESAKHLGFFANGCVMADTESDLDLVMDTAIYDYYPTGNKNAVARFAAQHPLDGDEKTVVDAMLRARFTLVEIGEAVEGVGVEAHDMLLDEQFLLADVALSATGQPGIILATRLLTFDSFKMTTGIHVVVHPDVAPLVTSARDKLGGHTAAIGPRESSFLARFLLRLGMLEPEDARIMLADFALSRLPKNDPRRLAYARIRVPRHLEE
jgi:hypothetical protein